jgi:glycosyltransferase involved in cell wall biosynthesis
VKSESRPRIVFLDLGATPLFVSMVEGLSETFGPCVFHVGRTGNAAIHAGSKLEIVFGCGFNKSSLPGRAWSWFRFFFSSWVVALSYPRDALLFIGSNPPINQAIGHALKILRKQKYVILIHDLFPHALEADGLIRRNSLFARLWNAWNRKVWKASDGVYTIGNRISEEVCRICPSLKEKGKIATVYPWSDTEWIQPVPKDQNRFAREHGQLGKITVLYSGNLGIGHDIQTFLEAAKVLRDFSAVGFMIVGTGAKWQAVNQFGRTEELGNLTILPLQRAEVFPSVVATGDIAIVTMKQGTRGISLPSKLFSYLAAGCAVIGIAERDTELADIIIDGRCGELVEPGDVSGLVEAIRKMVSDPAYLQQCRRNARELAVANFNQEAGIERFRVLLEDLIEKK